MAAEQERQRLLVEAKLRSLESSAAAERAKGEEWKAQQTSTLESSRGERTEREAALQLRIQQMELSVRSAAAAAEEAHKREMAQVALVKQLQMRQEQASAAAASAVAAKNRFGGRNGSTGEILAAMAQVQAHAEALQSELSAPQRAERRAERAQATARAGDDEIARAAADALAQAEAERQVQQAQYELTLSRQAAGEVRLQADLLKQRLAAQLSAEQKRAEMRESTLAQQREAAAQALASERQAHASTKREASAAVSSAQEEVRSARALVLTREAVPRWPTRRAGRRRARAAGRRG